MATREKKRPDIPSGQGAHKSALRKSVTLTERDDALLTQVKTSGVRLAALSRIAAADVSASSSEAAILRAVMTAGINAIEEEIEERGYADIASSQSDLERQAASRRRRPAWADE